MAKPSKIKYSTEDFVWRVSNGLEDRLTLRMNEIEEKNEKRYNKMMNVLIDILGKFKKFDEERVVVTHRQSVHSDQIKELQAAVFPAS